MIAQAQIVLIVSLTDETSFSIVLRNKLICYDKMIR